MKVKTLLALLARELQKNPAVTEYEIIWSNAVGQKFEICPEGRYVMMGEVPRETTVQHRGPSNGQ